MPDSLHLQPFDIDTVEKRGKYRVSVIGCGLKGLNYGIALAEAGFKVVCTDANQSIVKRLSRGTIPLHDRVAESKLKKFARTEMLSFSSDTKSAVAQCDIILLTVEVKIDSKKSADYLEIETSCKQIGAVLRKDKLVIYGGIANLGLMEGIVKETLENTSGLKAGEDFGLAYNPIMSFDANRSAESFSNRGFTVAANDNSSLSSAAAVLSTLTRKTVKQIQDFKRAELAALFAVARRDVNMALSNELAMLCENAGKDYFETLEIATKEFSDRYYDAAVGEEIWRKEAYLFLENAENLNAKLRLTTVARQINENMTRHAVGLVQDALRSCGKTLRRARVTLLDSAKPRTLSDDFIKIIEAKGAKIVLFSPYLSRNVLDMKPVLKNNLSEAAEGSDCIIILNADSQFSNLNLKNLRTVMRTPAAIVDLARIIHWEEVEKEGFIYRGLGKGAEKK